MAAELAACPRCGVAGAEIARRTVAAVSRAPLPPHQVLRLCRTPGCPLIYYGDASAVIEAASLAMLPPFKGGDVLCFCYCACDLRNPTSKCCLPEIRGSGG